MATTKLTEQAALPKRLVFFLGGSDLEMRTIRDLLAAQPGVQYYDKQLSWGAKASAYRDEIQATLAHGGVPVLVELENDLDLDSTAIVVADHHGERAGSQRPTSLHHIFDLLQLPPECWTRWFELVAANDRGYIPALLALGASREEIAVVRAADRAAQGITPEDEAVGEQAIRHATTLAHGNLTVVQLPHNRTATVTDRLQPELGGPGYVNMVIKSPEEVNFFGAGDLVYRLNDTFPGGWYGGALPERGFWGHGPPVPDVIPALLAWLTRVDQP